MQDDAKPNLFLVGAMKAGTTTLSDLLSDSIDVFSPLIKEPAHFGTDIHLAEGAAALALHRQTLAKLLSGDLSVPRHFLITEDRADYLQLYAERSDQPWALDASTTYLYSQSAAAEIHQFNPDARIVIVTREPVLRAWSEFRMNQRIGIADTDYLAALAREEAALDDGRLLAKERYVSAGLYARQIARFRAHFSDNQILVLSFETMRLDPDTFVDQVGQWLGIALEPGAMGRQNSEAEARLPGLNRFLHKTGLKRVLRNLVPNGVRETARRSFYVEKKHAMPRDFAIKFEDIYRRYS